MQIFERFDIFANELHVTLFGLNVHLLKKQLFRPCGHGGICAV